MVSDIALRIMDARRLPLQENTNVGGDGDGGRNGHGLHNRRENLKRGLKEVCRVAAGVLSRVTRCCR